MKPHFIPNLQLNFYLYFIQIKVLPVLFFYCNTTIASCKTETFKNCLHQDYGEKKYSLTETLQAVLFKLPLLEARAWSAGSPFLQLHHSSITEGRFTNEGRSAPSSSVTVVLAILSILLVSIPLGSPLIVWHAAECDARGGHVNVISMQQMTALRETVTFSRCPSG